MLPFKKENNGHPFRAAVVDTKVIYIS